MTERALVIGEALIDIVQKDGVATGEHVGGSPLNVAIGLGRLGRDVDFLTHIGRDDRGKRIADYAKHSGVQLVSGSQDAARTPTAVAHLDASGAATYEFDIEWKLTGTPEAAPPLVAHTGSIAAYLDPGALATAALLDTYRTSATITYDPNVRPALISDREQAIARITRLVEKADVVKASDEDLRWIDPDLPPERIADGWLAAGGERSDGGAAGGERSDGGRSGPSIVAVTMGGRGAYAVCAAGSVVVPAREVEVVDTVGAGDAFMTGLIDALWSLDLLGGHRRAALAAISTADLERVTRAASNVASVVVTRAGADLPDRAALSG